MLYTTLGFACALLTNPKIEQTTSSSDSEQLELSEDSATQVNTNESDDGAISSLDGQQGALITSDCLYGTYTYAIDILLSCGNERLDDELRLHTFKRHSYAHKKIFNDQRITYRGQHLWFDSYTSPRCVWTDNQGRFYLSTDADDCAHFTFIADGTGYLLQDIDSGKCAGLGGTVCSDHQWTGGDECGGVDHRYLPLRLGDCADGLRFSFASVAEACADEYPESYCF